MDSSPIRPLLTRKENLKGCSSRSLDKVHAPVKRKPLSTISHNVLAQMDEARANTSKRSKPSSPVESIPAVDKARLASPEDSQGRKDELNLAWLDMCCALLDKKRSMHAPVARPTDMWDLMLPSIERSAKETPTTVKLCDPSPPSTTDIVGEQPRDLDVANIALALHENSQPSSTCCGCKTGCLKLYCRCFLMRGFCTRQCTCVSCLNTKTSTQRLPAITMHLKNNVHAFRASSLATPVVANGMSHDGNNAATATGSNFVPLVPNDHANAIACRCKKSKCSKKYCDCFQAGIACGPRCQCRDCCNHSPKETNTKQIIYAKDTIKVIVTRTPRLAPGTGSTFRVLL
ncbi:hypothetical protein AaE_010970 [Aphanomyces astaci]|uniref:CRC domain-containing protein n=1 Tax=Aphanomyces astaci TaxID=112090 RepID=A0A6A4ZMN5_APHAT|nr:hypothetical protein AaE_010970 [Aphanomyces astaci]